ncbi:ANX protein [Geosmithia morbida]|uniref:ANX protein n=1 Tax=Geosmithia morbida TaxID=1094350 RepID=A0A9P4YZN6_9HYPO|nr:ANX protein [Geosmithia morbida]KAF4124719.1 ANX protein [Geosmithia morbida]
MSLHVGDGSDSRRTRSRSRDRRSGDETKPSYIDSRDSSYAYPEADLDAKYRPRHDEPLSSSARASSSGLPYPAEGEIDNLLPGDQSLYSYDSHHPIRRATSPAADPPYRSSRDKVADAPSHRSSRDKVVMSDAPPGALPREDDDSDDGKGDDRRGETKKERKERRQREAKEKEKGSSQYADDNERLDKYLPSKYSASASKRRDDSDDERPPLPDRRGQRAEEGERSRVDYLPQKYSSAPADKPGADNRHSYGKDRVQKIMNLPQRYLGRYHDSHDSSSSDQSKSSDREERRRRKKERDEEDLAYGKPPGPPRSSVRDDRETWGSYMSGSKWEDKHRQRPGHDDPRREDYRRRDDVVPASPSGARHRRGSSYADDPRGPRPEIRTVEPGNRRRDDEPPKKPPRPSDTLKVGTTAGGRDRSRSRDSRRESGHRREKSDTLTVGAAAGRNKSRSRSRDGRRDRSPQPQTKRMSSLTVDTGLPAAASLSAASGSPMLESYRGTYQDCSPMPSPLLLASGGPGGAGANDDVRVIEALSPAESDVDADGKKRTRRARFHDAEDIASRLAVALRGDGPPQREPLVEILPSLTHEQVMQLRADYKAIVKTGSQRKGVNIAKHIRARLKDENPNLMKACYAVALGQWESEAYWANYWYQGDKTRRELLIESLMGRTNAEVRRIKDAFTDKKYDNSLTKCMKTELKEDKFKKAVLMVLDERRMDEVDDQGRRLPLDYRLVDKDVDDLWKAIKSEKGGESLMISIVVQRSDAHLREVLKEYEAAFHSNFARDSLKKSGNLVGELLAHILNGIINRPVRDALLLHHALTASRKDELRHELLTSRLVRLHWDASHMQDVRRAYLDRYGVELQNAVREATSGHWGMFCEELCIARVPSAVRTLHVAE